MSHHKPGLLHRILVDMSSSDSDFLVEQKEPHVAIELYETHLLMIAKYRYNTEDERLGMMTEEAVDDIVFIPIQFNITPKIVFVENRYYKFLVDAFMPGLTTPIFKTKEQAMELFDKVVAWKLGTL